MTKQKGFTLVEIILVIAIITVLAAGSYVALRPDLRLKEARDARRAEETNTLRDALFSYKLDHDSEFPSGVDTSLRMIGTDVAGCNSACGLETTEIACLDLSSDLAPYLGEMPEDPKDGTPGKTQYAVKKTANLTLKVIACTPEIETEIASEQ
ncbi:type II secretion system GspH family protein [Patescibacteria group bacterium]|nr:type II secretion system GspH family protein [Patescibacteria group bacterium]